MIDKPFLESELKRLGDQYNAAQKQSFDLASGMQQLLGAIQMLQMLVKKAEDVTAGDINPAVASED